jgi:UDP-2-acetamido-2,6-beta-L-arabino-hexul-4-ose reductase
VTEGSKSILVTGAEGFIGRHVVEALSGRGDLQVVGVDRDSSLDALPSALDTAEVIFHLAGINRPETPDGYIENRVLAQTLCHELEQRKRTPLVVFSSSTQADLDNPYGRSKRDCEEVLEAWANKTGAGVAIFRLPNVFGKWSRPNYNSAVATFSHNAARGMPLSIHDPAAPLTLVYIDDVVEAFLACLEDQPKGCDYRRVEPAFSTTVGDVADLILSFPGTRQTLVSPDFADPLTRRLYATYLSFLPEDHLAYDLRVSSDDRGALAELIKQPGFGQIFVSRTAPGITRGNHYHHTKTEKFLVVEGQAVIRFRDVRGGPVTEYRVDGREFKVLDIPPGFTHSIGNVGQGELVTIFYADEVFDPEHPDTYYLPVLAGEDHRGAS